MNAAAHIARDYDTFEEALRVARENGATHLTTPQRRFLGAASDLLGFVYRPASAGGYLRQPLFQEFGKWHLGAPMPVQKLPPDAHPLASSEASEMKLGLRRRRNPIHPRTKPEKYGVSRYEVVVGNIGTVYDGHDEVEALETYNAYVIGSKSGRGRAGHEVVTLFADGELALSFDPEGVTPIWTHPRYPGWAHDEVNRQRPPAGESIQVVIDKRPNVYRWPDERAGQPTGHIEFNASILPSSRISGSPLGIGGSEDDAIADLLHRIHLENPDVHLTRKDLRIVERRDWMAGGTNEPPGGPRDDAWSENMRRALGTVGHNRHFTARELAEYLGGHVSSADIRRHLQALTRAGYVGLDTDGYFVTRLGWTWIEGGAQENPRRRGFYQRDHYYRRRYYFAEIYNALLDRFGFTSARARRALDVYRRDIHDYYDHAISASKTAALIDEYFAG